MLFLAGCVWREVCTYRCMVMRSLWMRKGGSCGYTRGDNANLITLMFGFLGSERSLFCDFSEKN